MVNDLTDRDVRQRTLVPPDKLAEMKATVVGVGAIGRQVTLQLAAIGVPEIQLIDFDVVSVENLAPQGFYPVDVGRPKVESVADICRAINPNIEVYTANRKFRSLQFTVGAFFCCVDGIATREQIFKTIIKRADIFIDGRMSAEYLRVLTVHDEQSRKYYPTTLFSSSEAYQGPCTAKSTIYCSNVAAGIMVSQFAQWLRGYPIDKDIDLNLLTNEMGAK